MSEQSRTTLKGYFETGDTPTESQFANLLDSVPNFETDFSEKFVHVNLSSAQIGDLNANPVTLAAAPGPGKINILSQFYVKLNPVTTAYTGTGYIYITYSGFDTDLEGWIGRYNECLTVNNELHTYGYAENGQMPIASAYPQNRAMILKKQDVWADGDATLDFYVWYRVLTL